MIATNSSLSLSIDTPLRITELMAIIPHRRANKAVESIKTVSDKLRKRDDGSSWFTEPQGLLVLVQACKLECSVTVNVQYCERCEV